MPSYDNEVWGSGQVAPAAHGIPPHTLAMIPSPPSSLAYHSDHCSILYPFEDKQQRALSGRSTHKGGIWPHLLDYYSCQEIGYHTGCQVTPWDNGISWHCCRTIVIVLIVYRYSWRRLRARRKLGNVWSLCELASCKCSRATENQELVSVCKQC